MVRQFEQYAWRTSAHELYEKQSVETAWETKPFALRSTNSTQQIHVHAGICCDHGNLDICGVCGGDGTTCTITSSVMLDAKRTRDDLEAMVASVDTYNKLEAHLREVLACRTGNGATQTLSAPLVTSLWRQYWHHFRGMGL